MSVFFFLSLIFAVFLPVQSAVDPEVHNLCKDAKDYQGCINANSKVQVKSSNINDDIVQGPHWVDGSSVRQLKIRGKYGRYITFTGRTVFNAYNYSFNTGTAYGSGFGTQNYMSPTGQPLGSSYGSSYGTATGNSFGQTTGVRADSFVYELDCQDGTTDRKGDAEYAQEDTAGWFKVYKDPTAQLAFNKYCPIISKLPK